MSDDNKKVKLITKITGGVSHYTDRKLKAIGEYKKLPVSRLLSIAIEHELEKENPFEYDLTIPESGVYGEFEYAHEASLLIDFLKTVTATNLEVLTTIRHDIGIPDKQALLAAMRECIDNGVVEEFIPKITKWNSMYAPDHLNYRIKGSSKTRRQRAAITRKSTEYEKYLKLKKKFEQEA